MAKPVKLLHFTAEERSTLVEAIPFIRKQHPYYWEQPKFMELYNKWIRFPNNPYVDGGIEQFTYAVAQMRKALPLTYKTAYGYEMKSEYTDQDIWFK